MRPGLVGQVDQRVEGDAVAHRHERLEGRIERGGGHRREQVAGDGKAQEGPREAVQIMVNGHGRCL